VLGQLDEAEAALTPLLATPPQHRVSPLLRRMNDVSSTVLDSQHRMAPVALRIREVATAFSRESAGKPRELST